MTLVVLTDYGRGNRVVNTIGIYDVRGKIFPDLSPYNTVVEFILLSETEHRLYREYCELCCVDIM